MKGATRNGRWWVLAVAVPLALAMLYPLVWMVRVALTTPDGWGWQNFREVWRGAAFDRYLFNSAVVAVAVVGGNALFASMVGYALARRRFGGSRGVMALVLSTLMVPRQVTMIPLYLLIARLGWIDTYWALTVPFLVDAFNVFLMRQAFLGVPVELEEAARVDGAGEWKIFWSIGLPLVKPSLAVLAINTFLTHWNSFLYPLVLTNTERMRTLPVGLALYSQGEHSVDWGLMMAGSTIAVLPVVALFVAFQRHIVSGIMAGAGR